MEGRRSGRGRERGPRQPLNQGGNHEPTAEQNCEPGAFPNAQVATTIQRITDLLTQIVDRQGRNPTNQPGNTENHVEGEDRALE